MIKSIHNAVALARMADFTKPWVRDNYRRFYLPRLKSEAAMLAACRSEMRGDEIDDWSDAGCITEEVEIRQAICTAERRLEATQ